MFSLGVMSLAVQILKAPPIHPFLTLLRSHREADQRFREVLRIVGLTVRPQEVGERSGHM